MHPNSQQRTRKWVALNIQPPRQEGKTHCLRPLGNSHALVDIDGLEIARIMNKWIGWRFIAILHFGLHVDLSFLDTSSFTQHSELSTEIRSSKYISQPVNFEEVLFVLI